MTGLRTDGGRLSVTARWGLASLAAVVVLGLLLAAVVHQVVGAQATAEATRSGALAARFVSQGIAPSALDRAALTADERSALDDVLRGADDVRRLRLWARNGRLLYDSAAPVDAPVHPVGPMLARAYAGEVASHVRPAAGAGSLLSVYVPLHGDGSGAAGVVEVDLVHDATAARAEGAVLTLAGLLAAALAGLWALLWWLARYVTRALRRTADEQERLATTDALTGLPNRRALLTAVDDGLGRGESCALLLVEVERFKDVNATLGHHVGDRLLQEVGHRLVDAAPAGATVGRLEGGDYAILLPSVLLPDDAALVAAALAAALERPFAVDGVVLTPQARTGIALAPRHALSGGALLQRADVALALAASRGTTAAVYDEELDRSSTDRLLMLGDLKRGLAAGELSLVYQPCYDLQEDGRCMAVEALVRWHSPTRGFVSPAEFVPLCERSDLVRDLTSYVLGEALRQLRAWEDAGTVVNVAVNLSASNLSEDDLPELVAGLLARHRVAGDRIVLEITESAVIPDPQRAARVLGRLVELGIDIAIDDFGTGWSSMSRLLELPLSALKVDRSFVADVPGGPGAAVVSATTRLAHDLGLFVVGEGIETPEQLEHLRRLGCDVGQGYLLSRPLHPRVVPAAVRVRAGARVTTAV